MEQDYIDELQQLLTSAKHPRVISLLEKALAEATSIDTVRVNGSVKPGEGDGEFKPLMKQKDNSISFVKVSNYGWDQSDKFVKIYISDIKGLDTLTLEKIRSEFSQSAIKVELLDVLGKNYGLTISNLYSAIDTEKSSVKIKSGMVIISACKRKPSESWQFLTAREKKLKDSKEHKPPKLGDDDKSDPGQGLMKLMQQMYDDGDEEMKRTIAKSWYESQEKRKKEGFGSESMDM